MPSIRKFIAKVQETGFIVNATRRERARTVRTPENIKAVAESVLENSSTSTRHCSHEWNILCYIKFCQNILVWRLTQFNWLKSCSLLTIRFAR